MISLQHADKKNADGNDHLRFALTCFVISLQHEDKKNADGNDHLRFALTCFVISLQHVCVCVFFPSILDIKFVGCTSRGHTGGRSHRIFNPPSFCGACLDFCREKDSAIPFPRRP